MRAPRPYRVRVESDRLCYSPYYVERWNAMSDDEKREKVQELMDALGEDFSPSPLIMAWLFERAGVELG